MTDDLTTPRGLFERIDEVQVLDVREPFEWTAGHIEGAVHVPLGDVMAGREQVSRDRPVVAVCRVGNRSEVASLMLRARGYDAYNLEGGMEAWAAEDLPFVADDGGPPRVV